MTRWVRIGSQGEQGRHYGPGSAAEAGALFGVLGPVPGGVRYVLSRNDGTGRWTPVEEGLCDTVAAAKRSVDRAVKSSAQRSAVQSAQQSG